MNARNEHQQVDPLRGQERSARMARIRHKDSRVELRVRRLAHGLGYRFRLHASDLPGRPDLVFRPRRKVVFVHGCFWHRHPGCSRARMPKSRVDFWHPKLEGNRARDIRQLERLNEMGWQSLIIWECEAENQPDEELRERITSFLEGVA